MSTSAIFIVVQNEWLATDSQNAIYNNFEEYYTGISGTDLKSYRIFLSTNSLNLIMLMIPKLFKNNLAGSQALEFSGFI